MALPPPYTRSYSFSDYQANNPSQPLPGPQVDNELENIEQSLGEAIDAVNDIRRSDGALKNGIVTYDSMAPEVREDFNDKLNEAAASAEAAAISEGQALSAKIAAETARDFAAKWASSAIVVDDGQNRPDYSSKFWAAEAKKGIEDAVSQGNVPIYSTAQALTDLNIPEGINYLRTNGYGSVGDGGGAAYRESGAEEVETYPNPAWFTSNGGSRYWLIDDAEISMASLGARTDAEDNASAINDWLAALKAFGRPGYFPAGTFDFQSQISLALANNIVIRTAGERKSVLRYTGSATDIDLVIFGDGVTSIRGWLIEGFRVTSVTAMTDGWAIRFRRLARSHIGAVLAEGQDGHEALGGSRLWNGIFWDAVDIVSCSGFQSYAKNIGAAVAGALGAGPKADLYLGGGYKIGGGAAVGFLVGGAFGGLHLGAGDIIGNGTNLCVDNSLTAEVNREIMVGDGCFIDSGINVNVHFNGTIGGSCWAQFDNTWIATTTGLDAPNVWIEKANTHRIQFNGGTNYNANGDGFRVDDTSAVVQIIGVLIRNNGGWGVNATAPTGNCSVYARYISNASGDIHANVFGRHDFSGRVVAGGFGLDSTAYTQLLGGNPAQNVDTNDYHLYNRSGNAYEWYIGGSKIGRITVDGIFGTAGVGCDGGGWNTGRLYLGSHQLWVDADGRLRIKTGSNPTSDTDGTIVGTQS